MIDAILNKLLEAATGGAASILVEAIKRKNKEQLSNYEMLKTREKNLAKPEPITASITAANTVLRGALHQHIAELKRWSANIKFSDLKGIKSISQVYVELDTYLMPLSVQESEIEKDHRQPLLEAIRRSDEHCVILGTAGAGKTTSVQKICNDFFSHGKALANHNFPILIKLRTISDNLEYNPLISAFCKTLSLDISFSPEDLKLDDVFIADTKRKMVTKYLDELNAAILLDGFDELATESLRDKVEHDIVYLIEHLRKSRLLITSRSADFRYKFSSLPKYEIAPLANEQIQKFATKWLQSKEKSDDFLKKVLASPFADTTIRPLTIAHLCAIYERIQDIPEKPKSVYRRVVRLLLEEWDSQRHIRRPSAYANFDHDRKLDFLAHLAYYLTVELRQLRFSSDSLKKAYRDIHKDHGLPESQALQVVAELESHSGLILESGYGYFEFAHKSIQEYLAADYIVRLPTLSDIAEQAELLPNELAIATALSSKPSAFLAELFLRVVDIERRPSAWLATYLSRLGVEKPDLNVGASEYSAVAATHLIWRTDKKEAASKLLASALPENTEQLLKKYYQVATKDRYTTEFRRIGTSHKYNLPGFLLIPTPLLIPVER